MRAVRWDYSDRSLRLVILIIGHVSVESHLEICLTGKQKPGVW